MTLRPTTSQERGVILLVGFGILAAGFSLFLPGLAARAPGPPRPIELARVRVLVPTFREAEAKKPLDLNAATVEELVRLPGIGEVLAARIVAYREEHGPFQKLEDLKRVSGIGGKVVEGIRNLVTVRPVPAETPPP